MLHINAGKAKNWDTREVITRWHKLFNGTPLTHRYLANSLKYQVEREAVETLAATWREQLMSISWYMRVLNEGIAREANTEDQCTGRYSWKPSMVPTASRQLYAAPIVPDKLVGGSV